MVFDKSITINPKQQMWIVSLFIALVVLTLNGPTIGMASQSLLSDIAKNVGINQQMSMATIALLTLMGGAILITFALKD